VKNALIVLVIVALVMLTLGLVNRDAVVDVDYVVGVWRSVNVLWLFAIAAAVLLAAGLVGAALARAQGWRERGKLEKELLEVYRRLRAVEAQAEATAGAASGAAAAAEARTMGGGTEPPGRVQGATVASAPDEAATTVPGSPEATTVVSEPSEATTAVSEPPEASTAVSEPGESATELRPAGDGPEAPMV